MTPDGGTSDFEIKGVASSNTAPTPKTKQGVTEEKTNLSPVELAAFWGLPLAPLAMLAEVLGTTPQGVGRLGLFPLYRVGSALFCKPIEIAHGFRALKAEVAK